MCRSSVKPTTRPVPRRGLSRREAAIYIGISSSKFDQMVRDGRMPPAKRIDARKVWDIHQLDASFDDLPSDGHEGANPWDQTDNA
jgi:predicted DNA-binding transcriptional regulator AlpA